MDLSNYNPMINIKKIINTLVLTIIIVGVGMLIARLTGPIPLSITQTLTQKQSTFDVTGESEIISVPNQVEIRLGISAQASTVDLVQEQANTVINKIIKELDGLGVDKKDIKTQNYSINPNYDYKSGNQRITGYQINTQLLVKLTDFDKLNEAIDMATSQGANQVGGISFSLSKEKEDELRKQAREEAIKDAKDSAEELAKLAGIKLGRVINVSESPNNEPVPIYRQAAVSLDSDEEMKEPTQIQPGSTTYTYSVTLSYETL